MGRQGLGGDIFVQIYVLIFQSPEESFHEDVIQCAPLAIHGNLDSFAMQERDVILIGELSALVAVDDFWFTIPEGSFQATHHNLLVQGRT